MVPTRSPTGGTPASMETAAARASPPARHPLGPFRAARGSPGRKPSRYRGTGPPRPKEPEAGDEPPEHRFLLTDAHGLTAYAEQHRDSRCRQVMAVIFFPG